MLEKERPQEEKFCVKSGGISYLLPVACPHRGGKLSCGHINEKSGRITCPLHFSTFDIATGRRIGGPALTSLSVVPIDPRVNSS